MNAAPHEKFKGGFGNGEVNALCPEKGEFFRYGKLADFALGVGGKRLENNFLAEPSDEFRLENRKCFLKVARAMSNLF